MQNNGTVRTYICTFQEKKETNGRDINKNHIIKEIKLLKTGSLITLSDTAQLAQYLC